MEGQPHSAQDHDEAQFFNAFSTLMEQATTLGLDHITERMQQILEQSPAAYTTSAGTIVDSGSIGPAHTLPSHADEAFRNHMNYKENIAHGLIHANAAIRLEIEGSVEGAFDALNTEAYQVTAWVRRHAT